MEFSNVLLLVVALGAAAINPLFDALAPFVARRFKHAARPSARHACC